MAFEELLFCFDKKTKKRKIVYLTGKLPVASKKPTADYSYLL